jgi:enoyl-CoA hydratase
MADVLVEETLAQVRLLTLNRPEARNALSGTLFTALYRALLAADADEGVQVIVLTGTDPAFCAGIDLKEMVRDPDGYRRVIREDDCIAQVGRVRKPVIGAINGATFTGGLELALGCDFLLASERAVFADTHARVGILPGGGLTARLPRVVGSAMARRMSMTSEIIDAAAALRVGLVTEVVPHEQLRPRALELAAMVADVPAATMAGLKQMYVRGAATTVDPALSIEREIGARHTPTPEALDRQRQAVLQRNRRQLAPPQPQP